MKDEKTSIAAGGDAEREAAIPPPSENLLEAAATEGDAKAKAEDDEDLLEIVAMRIRAHRQESEEKEEERGGEDADDLLKDVERRPSSGHEDKRTAAAARPKTAPTKLVGAEGGRQGAPTAAAAAGPELSLYQGVLPAGAADQPLIEEGEAPSEPRLSRATDVATAVTPGAYSAVGSERGARLEPIRRDSFSSSAEFDFSEGLDLDDSEDEERGLAVANPVDESHTHHLPQAEEHDRDRENKEGDKQCRNGTLFGGLALMGIFAVFVALLLLSGSSDEDAAAPIRSPTATVFPETPSNAPTSIEGSVMALLPEDTIVAIQDNSESPQSRAWQWLWQDKGIILYKEERIIQKFVLATLFYAAGGDGWTNNTHWLDHSIDECNWYTKPDYARKKIISSLFPGYLMDFLEPLPERFCDESGLYQHLWLDGNNLEGSLPEELYLLTSLTTLSTGFNPLKGTISPNIGALTSLVALHLGDMEHEGAIPSELGLLTNLEHFEAWGSTFKLGGTIPTEIWQLTNLSHFGLAASSQLKGTIPSEIGTFQKLTWLTMVYCSLSGTIPSEIGELEDLKVLYLDHNQFTGTLPSEMGRLKKARLLSSFSNQLNGTIPSELGELTASTQLSLWGNQFTGTVPSEFGRLTDLAVTLNMKSNRLTGTLPTELGLLSNLYELDFQDNEFTGPIPSELGQLSSIGQLSFAANSLSGTVPEELSALSPTLYAVSFTGNSLLSGFIPNEFCQLNNTCARTPWNTYGCNMEPGVSHDCTEALKGCNCA